MARVRTTDGIYVREIEREDYFIKIESVEDLAKLVMTHGEVVFKAPWTPGYEREIYIEIPDNDD